MTNWPGAAALSGCWPVGSNSRENTLLLSLCTMATLMERKPCHAGDGPVSRAIPAFPVHPPSCRWLRSA